MLNWKCCHSNNASNCCAFWRNRWQKKETKKKCETIYNYLWYCWMNLIFCFNFYSNFDWCYLKKIKIMKSYRKLQMVYQLIKRKKNQKKIHKKWYWRAEIFLRAIGSSLNATRSIKGKNLKFLKIKKKKGKFFL